MKVKFIFFSALGFCWLMLWPNTTWSTELYSSYDDFFTRGGRGELSVKIGGSYHAYSRSEVHKLPQKKLHVYINHKNKESDGEYKYIAVSVIRFYLRDQPISEKIALKRNEAWICDGNPGECNEEFSNDVSLFANLHKKKNIESSELNAWHATLPGSNDSSWDKRNHWANSNYETLGLKHYQNSDYQKQYSFRLYSFKENDREKSKKPLNFEIITHGCAAITVQVYCPYSDMYDGLYHFEER